MIIHDNVLFVNGFWHEFLTNFGEIFRSFDTLCKDLGCSPPTFLQEGVEVFFAVFDRFDRFL